MDPTTPRFSDIIVSLHCKLAIGTHYYWMLRSQTRIHYTIDISTKIHGVIDNHIISYLHSAKLYDFHQVAYARVDRALVTAVVERWRQVTHTFHLPLVELTITSLGIIVLSRLPMKGTHYPQLVANLYCCDKICF